MINEVLKNLLCFQLAIHRLGYPFNGDDQDFEWALQDQIDLVVYRDFLKIEVERLRRLLGPMNDNGE
jgi:hypothetical protein